jgi:hypothetical protein
MMPVDITQFNRMRYPSVNSRSSLLASGVSADHDINELRREVAKLRRHKQELEKQNLVRDAQLTTLQLVLLPLVNGCYSEVT